MLTQFNMSIYDHKCNQPSTSSAAREQEDEEDKVKNSSVCGRILKSFWVNPYSSPADLANADS